MLRQYSYYESKGTSAEFERHLKFANEGDAQAQAYIGNCYADGDGIKQDYAQAVAWYQKAATQGNAQAQKNLGD